jgi:hypothetical protein
VVRKLRNLVRTTCSIASITDPCSLQVLRIPQDLLRYRRVTLASGR